jgi:hypothetical protein
MSKILITYVAPAIAVVFCIIFQLTNAAGPVPIYGEDSKPVGLPLEGQKIIVGILTILIFIFMALEWFTPEVLLFSSLIVCLLLQILTLPETLAGMFHYTRSAAFSQNPFIILLNLRLLK